MDDHPMKSTFLQEGSYGCVFTPPLPCKKSKIKKGKQTIKIVGKLMRRKDATSELLISRAIQEIKGYERYFIVQEIDNCDKKNFQGLRESYENSCEIYKKRKDTELIQLLSPYGGTTLFYYPITPKFDFIGTFRHVLEGVVELEKKGICHYDLHESNIVLDWKGTARAIDFGSAFKGDELEENQLWRLQYEFDPDYPPQPPEIAIQNAIHDSIPINEGILEVIKEREIVNLKESLLGISRRDQYNELYEFWHTDDTTWNGKEWHPFFKAYWRKIDPWSVGVMFLNILKRMMYFREFENNVWRKHQGIIIKVLKGLLRMNPIHRYSAGIALKMLETL